MLIDYINNKIEISDSIILQNDDTAIRINGFNDNMKTTVNLGNSVFCCRTNKSKLITKIKWIIAVIKFKL